MKDNYLMRVCHKNLILAVLSIAGPLAVGLHASNTTIALPDFPSGPYHHEVVLFAFDNWAFPYQCRVQTHLITGRFNSIVLHNGVPGSYDEHVMFYGTVLRIGGKFQMWYIGASGDEDPYEGGDQGDWTHLVICYATSGDGVHWEKPNLGLVEFNGSKQNNIVDFPDRITAPAAAVIYDLQDPDPNRRYKMAYETRRGNGVASEASFCVAFSPDGLHWRQSPLNPVGPFIEPTGVTKFKGKYYVTGHDFGEAHRPFPTRKLATFVSVDFEHWSPCAAVGLDRSTDVFGPSMEDEYSSIMNMGEDTSWNTEEAHCGAALWNRGNVIIGIYGQWHKNPEGDRRMLTMDLGMTITHDAIHHYEPIPGFRLVPAREQPGNTAAEKFPALIQGQGMENVGTKTYYWYGLWRALGDAGVRLVTWDRDRLGMLKPFASLNQRAALPHYDPEAISCAFRISPGGKARLYVNASGLGQYSNLRINLLDDSFRPIEGYSGNSGAVINNDGLRVPIVWNKTDTIDGISREMHLQVRFEGIRPEDPNLHAVYIVPVDP